MAAKAQEISQEAGSKMAAAMKDVISAAAGLTGFAIESARDLVQYMVRRGQMTQDEADKLIREAEVADAKRNPHPVPPPSRVPKPPPPERVESVPFMGAIPPRPLSPPPPAPARVEHQPPAPVPHRAEPARPMPRSDGGHATPSVSAKKPAAKSAPKKKAPTSTKAKPTAAKPAAKKKAPAKR